MQFLGYLQLLGVIIGFIEVIPALYKNWTTRNKNYKERAINHLSPLTAIIMVWAGIGRFPNIIRGYHQQLQIPNNSSAINRSAMVLGGTFVTYCLFFFSLLIMAGYYSTETEKQKKEKKYLRIAAVIYVILTLIIIGYFIHEAVHIKRA